MECDAGTVVLIHYDIWHRGKSTPSVTKVANEVHKGAGHGLSNSAKGPEDYWNAYPVIGSGDLLRTDCVRRNGEYVIASFQFSPFHVEVPVRSHGGARDAVLGLPFAVRFFLLDPGLFSM